MSMVLTITEPDGSKHHYNIGEATVIQCRVIADEELRRHPIGSTWAYSVVTRASWDAVDYRNETGELPPQTEKGN